MKRFMIAALVLFFTAISANAESIRAPRGFAGTLYKNTFVLYMMYEGIPHMVCTAEPFEKIKSGYLIVSAGHCVQDNPTDATYYIAEDMGGVLMPIKLIKAVEDDTLDFSEFEFRTNRKYAVLRVGDEHDARVGDRVLNINFSNGMKKQLSLGTVSSDILTGAAICAHNGCAGVFLVQIDGNDGASGSAVVSVRTRKIIGIVVDGFSGNVGMGIEPMSAFARFLAGPGQPHPPDQIPLWPAQ